MSLGTEAGGGGPRQFSRALRRDNALRLLEITDRVLALDYLKPDLRGRVMRLRSQALAEAEDESGL